MLRRLFTMLGLAGSTATSKIDIKADIERRLLAKSAPQEKSMPTESEAFSFGDARQAAQVFGTRSCPWSDRALSLFEGADIKATYLDLDHPGSDSIRKQLRSETGQGTVPYIYLRGQFIGGFDALDEINRLGQLTYCVLPEAEQLAHADHGKFEILGQPK